MNEFVELLSKDSEVYEATTGKTVARTDIGGKDEKSEALARKIAVALNTHSKLLESLNAILPRYEQYLNDCHEKDADYHTEVQQARSVIHAATFHD